MNNVLLLCVTETAHIKRNKKKVREKKEDDDNQHQQYNNKASKTNVSRVYKCVLQTSKKNKYIYSWKKSMLIVETIYSTEEKRNTIDHSHTVHRSIYSYKLMFVRKKNYLPKNEETE